MCLNQKGGIMKNYIATCENSCQIINSANITDLRRGFIETLTHDLKTPILAQIRALELLLENYFGKISSEQSEIIQLTLDSCKYMYEMVSTLISTYKYDNEEFELNYSKFNLIEIVENNIKQYEKIFKERNIQVAKDIKITSPFVFADLIRLQKTIQTLILNTINFAHKNTVLTVKISDKSNNIRIMFESNGDYISSEKFRRMFLQQTYNMEKYNKIGSGIGLYLVKKIIDKHNGTIIAKSNSDQKNVLGFEIPKNI